MNFFAHQDRARTRTRWLVAAFTAAVICILLLTNLVVMIVLANTGEQQAYAVLPSWAWILDHLGAVVATSVAVLLVISGASLYRVAQLSAGGGSVARSLGATQIPPDVTDPDHRRLRNVVEEIAIASGVPVPEIYVLEQESGINAFAAGFTISDAAIAVSRGCLDRLNRDELQGVIAHEFSHVLNGDMRMNVRLMGILFGILAIAVVGRQILRVGAYGGGRSRNGAPLLFVGLALLVIGFAGLFFGRLIQAAVSRQRELLADASAVQFTRNPTGIAGALKKIAASTQGSTFEAVDPTEISHMLFAPGMVRRLFATHPPLPERIKAIESRFDPAELKQIAAEMGQAGRSATGAIPAGAAGFADTLSSSELDSAPLLAQVGNAGWDHFRYAEALRETLPAALSGAAHSNKHAVDLVLALLIDKRPQVREQQLALIAAMMGADHRQSVVELEAEVRELEPRHRLPLVELALPALKTHPRSALAIYLKVMDRLIRADDTIEVFEFALSQLVRGYLVEAGDPGRSERSLRVREVRDQLALVLAILAHAGHADSAAAQHAFQAGWNQLFPMETRDYALPESWVDAATEALQRIDRLKPMSKEAVLGAWLTSLSHDGRITLVEVELLRAMCAAIHCPMPPQITA